MARDQSGQSITFIQKKFKSVTTIGVTWPTEPLSIGSWQLGPFCWWCHIWSSFLSFRWSFPDHHHHHHQRHNDKTFKIKIKPQTPTSTIIKCCWSTCSPCMRVWRCPLSQSLTQTRVHTWHGAADKHKHTHVSVHRPAHLCRTLLAHDAV